MHSCVRFVLSQYKHDDVQTYYRRRNDVLCFLGLIFYRKILPRSIFQFYLYQHKWYHICLLNKKNSWSSLVFQKRLYLGQRICVIMKYSRRKKKVTRKIYDMNFSFMTLKKRNVEIETHKFKICIKQLLSIID